MSRIGKQPVVLPKGVKAHLSGSTLTMEGPKGKLTLDVNPAVAVDVREHEIVCTLKDAVSQDGRAKFGLVRSLLQNMMEGVSKGYKIDLQIQGTGYRANVKEKELELALGFSHPILFPIPEGIKVAVDKQVRITLEGADKHLIGQTAAKIRAFRPPEPYKGKGVRYANEVVRKKAGKAAAAAGAGGA